MDVQVYNNVSNERTQTYGSIEAGYKAIVLTVDTPYFGRRLSEIRNRFKLPPHLKMANFPDALGVKTGSEHRTNDLEKKKGGELGERRTAPATSAPPNKNGKFISSFISLFFFFFFFYPYSCNLLRARH